MAYGFRGALLAVVFTALTTVATSTAHLPAAPKAARGLVAMPVHPRSPEAGGRAHLLRVNLDTADTAPAAMPAPPAPAPAAKPTIPAPRGDWLRSEDGRISVAVGVYDDPTGSQAVPEGMAVLDLAMRSVPYYFDGHNPGVFTPLLGESAGSVFDYWDGRGTLHRFRIVAVRSWLRASGEPPPVSGRVVAQFQTCRTLDGSVDWIYDAVAA